MSQVISNHRQFASHILTVKLPNHVSRFTTSQTSCHTLFFKIKNYLTSSLENFCDFSSSCGENSVKISRNDIDLVYFKKIKCERRFLNTAIEIRGLVVSPSICGQGGIIWTCQGVHAPGGQAACFTQRRTLMRHTLRHFLWESSPLCKTRCLQLRGVLFDVSIITPFKPMENDR